MDLFQALTIISTIFFASLSLFLSVRERRARKEVEKQSELQKQRLYQISILKEIQDRIGYSLDVEKVVDVITGSLKYFFPYSVSSSMFLKEGKIIFKAHIEESVSSNFIYEIKKNMNASLNALLPNAPLHIEEKLIGVPMDENRNLKIGSFFNIPLVVGNDVVGLINVSSTNRNLYKEEEVTLLFQIVGQASSALTSLKYLLETEKGKLTSMIGSLADGVFMVDTNKNLLIINDAAKDFLNIKAKNPTFTDILTSVGTQYEFSDKIEKSLQSNSQIVEKEVSINEKIFQTFITPVPDSRDPENPKAIGASILLHDITIEKNITTIKEDFTHMIVHELRAPLTAIKDSSELMIEVFDEKGSMEKEQQKRLLQIIDLQSKNLLEQINHVLDAAKIEAGRFTIQKTPTDIGKLIENTIEPFIPQAKRKQILITTDIIYPLPLVSLDPVRITQVLNNLISNSLKFTPPNGKITLSAKESNGNMVVSVKDNGAGIPESEQKDLFSKYYQIRTTPHELSKKGTGLGLYITKGIVEAHLGTVWVESNPGEGTEIFFSLPLKEIGPKIIQGHLPQASVSSLVN